MDYKEMLVLSYFKSHYKKYDYNEIMKLLGVTLCDLNNMMDKLLQNNMLLVYDGTLALSKEAEIFLKENQIPVIGTDEIGKIENTQKKIDIDEIYIPKEFKL